MNIESGKAALNISDAALGNITDYLQRMRELAVQAKGGFLSDSDRSAIQKEVDQLKQENEARRINGFLDFLYLIS